MWHYTTSSDHVEALVYLYSQTTVGSATDLISGFTGVHVFHSLILYPILGVGDPVYKENIFLPNNIVLLVNEV